jgi:hypothetical protein
MISEQEYQTHHLYQCNTFSAPSRSNRRAKARHTATDYAKVCAVYLFGNR